MDAVAALAQITSVQECLKVISGLLFYSQSRPPLLSIWYRVVTAAHHEVFDFIVVGAGSAGAVVAARLAESHAKVLLVEAGGDPPLESVMPGLFTFLPQSQYDWNYTNVKDNNRFQCQRNRTLKLLSGRVLGGSSSVDHSFYLRGCPDDFTPWAIAANDSTWDWKGVLPYYIKSEKLQEKYIKKSPLGKYHGTHGFLGVSQQEDIGVQQYLEPFRESGHDILLDINANSYVGYNYPPMFTIKDGVRQSTACTILAAQKCNPYLYVLKETLVTKIIFDKNNNAIGIKASTNNNKQIELRARKEVIVSAGALGTPRLLMLSGIGPQEHLKSLNIPVRSNLPVGMNLQDHLAVMMATKLEESTEPAPVPDPRRFPFGMFQGYVALNKSKCCPDYHTINLIIPNDSGSIFNLAFIFGYDNDIAQKIFEAGKSRKLMVTFVSILHPKSRGRVLLRSSNPKDLPLIDVGYLSDDRDFELIVDSLIDFVKVYKTRSFKDIDADMVNLELHMCKGLKYWSREWWRCYVKCMMTAYSNWAGTCALGSVVDSHLRVFGVNRLRVVDASIIPDLIGAKLNAAAIMIGEKGANFIKQMYNY